MKGPSWLAGRCEDVKGIPGILWPMLMAGAEAAEQSTALALLSLESTRPFFSTFQTSAGTKQLLPIIHVSTQDIGLGLGRKGSPSAAPHPAVCLHAHSYLVLLQGQ